MATASEDRARLLAALRQIEAFARTMATSEVNLSERILRAGHDDLATYAKITADEVEKGNGSA